MKNTHGGVLLLVKLTKSDTPPWVFFTLFFNCMNGTKLRKAPQMKKKNDIPVVATFNPAFRNLSTVLRKTLIFSTQVQRFLRHVHLLPKERLKTLRVF